MKNTSADFKPVIKHLQDGGITSPKGFIASGVHCGVRRNRDKKDLALIVSQSKAAAACVYTMNKVQGAPLIVTKKHLENGYASAIICNSGNANTCAEGGEELAEEVCELLSKATGIAADDIIVASTGVIGEKMSIAPFQTGIPLAVKSLSRSGSEAASAIMTTDTVLKSFAVEFTVGGKKAKLGGIAKGSGMIHPNMATMLVFLTTDAAVSAEVAEKLLREEAAESFNMISVDGDTSTNDMMCLMANGKAGNEQISGEGEDCETLRAALHELSVLLCRAIAGDGEGATKLITVSLTGAKDAQTAKIAARSVVSSSLVKTAIFGSDANWGRVLCALGYSGADFDVEGVDVAFSSLAGHLTVCLKGRGCGFDEALAKRVLSEKEITIEIALSDGEAGAVAYGCDLSYEYVKINGDYRT